MRDLTYLCPAIASLALLGNACVPTFDDDLTRITGPRVLAVRSVPAEAAPGETVALSVLVASPSDEGAASAETLSWAFCLSPKPLTELGPVAQTCIEAFGSSSDLLLPVGEGASLSAALPPTGCRNFGPLGPAAGSDGVSGRPIDPDPTGGYYQPLLVGEAAISLASPRISCGIIGVTGDAAIKYTAGYRPNENPELESLAWKSGSTSGTLTPGSDSPTDVTSGAQLTFSAQWAPCPRKAECGDGLCTSGENDGSCADDCSDGAVGCTGAETYLAANPETREVDERREGLTVSWFATAGTYASEATARLETDKDGTDSSNTWTAPSEAGEVRLWVVLRDDRGGVGWNEYRIQVNP